MWDKDHVVISPPSFSFQETALKIVQEISPPVPQPISHLHGGKDFFEMNSSVLCKGSCLPKPALPHSTLLCPAPLPSPCEILPIIIYGLLWSSCPKIALDHWTTWASLGPSLHGGLPVRARNDCFHFYLSSSAMPWACLMFNRLLLNYLSLHYNDLISLHVLVQLFLLLLKYFFFFYDLLGVAGYKL